MTVAYKTSFSDFMRNQFEDAFGGSMGDAVREALEPETIKFLGLDVNPAFITTLIVTAFLLLSAVIIRIFVIPKFKKVPGKFQILLESFISYFDKSTKEVSFKKGNFIGAYVFTAAIFIALSTLVELVGLRPAFANINACFGFGLMTFLVINISGFRKKGVGGRLKRYLNPINIITDVSVPLSLSLRLFGSIMSGFIIMELVYTVLFTSFVIPAAVSIVTTFFHALIQAYLFSTLTVIFVGEAME